MTLLELAAEVVYALDPRDLLQLKDFPGYASLTQPCYDEGRILERIDGGDDPFGRGHCLAHMVFGWRSVWRRC